MKHQLHADPGAAAGSVFDNISRGNEWDGVPYPLPRDEKYEVTNMTTAS